MQSGAGDQEATIQVGNEGDAEEKSETGRD